MVNTEKFIERLEKILAHYELSATVFADTIAVQRSSISHLLSGRNKPSLDFVLKVVHSFPEVNLYWLLNGKGSFPSPSAASAERGLSTQEHSFLTEKNPHPDKIDKIIIFYSDGSFREYRPALSSDQQ